MVTRLDCRRDQKNRGAETKPEEEAGRRWRLQASGFRYGLYEIPENNVGAFPTAQGTVAEIKKTAAQNCRRDQKNSGAETKPEEEAGRRWRLQASGFRIGSHQN